MKAMETPRYALHTYSNIGSLDRVARLVLASVLIGIPLSGVEPMAANVTMMLVAIPLVMSAIMAWDPIYAFFNVRTATLKARPLAAWNSDARDNDGLNVGWIDRIGRFGLGAALLSVTLLGTVDGAMHSYAALASIPVIMTGVIGWDPFYHFFGLRTATLPIETAEDYGSTKVTDMFTVFDAEPETQEDFKKAA